MKIELEVRTFEQRYGKRCPFCDKSWGDPTSCGDQRADWTIQKALGAIFADRRDKECEVCGKGIPVQYRFCYDCGHSKQAARNREDRHRRVSRVCAFCSAEFSIRSDKVKRGQRFCSLRCSNKARHAAKGM